ncbi:hypothetical protein [Novosphingobium sp. BL-8A]|uniref:hypothetical protein n=1 Tax=Novosphingobium sp. BL-8A TaxID=3127639 RepID=UPI003757DE78
MPDKLAKRYRAIRIQVAIVRTKQLPGCLDFACLHRLPFGLWSDRLDEKRPHFIHIVDAKTNKLATGECRTRAFRSLLTVLGAILIRRLPRALLPCRAIGTAKIP